MALLLLAKRRILTPLFPRFFSSTSTQSPNFMFHDYLFTSFGFSPDKASRISKRLAHLKSPEKPDAVLHYLKHQGFTDSVIKTLISGHPRILCSSPEATLDPNLRNLRSMGLSSSVLNTILLSSPCALLCSSAVPKINFWMNFLGGDEAALVKAFKRNRGLINHDISQSITPKFSLLQRHGYSTDDIGRIVATVSQFITTRISLMEDLLSRASELGFQPGSGMFLVALNTMTSVTREALQRKMELLMSFGWSEDEFFAALRKAPGWVQLSEKNLQEKMVFLVREAGCDPSYIASHPLLLPFSLEKRLRPRLHVLHLLESKGVSVQGRGFYTALIFSNQKFVDKYILPHKEEISGLHEAYLGDISGIHEAYLRASA